MGDTSQSATLTHWKKFYNKDYMGTWSLPNGKDVVVTIVKVERAEIKGEGGRVDIRPIVYFQEFKEPMVLNATNGKTIHRILGSEYVENWYGKRIQLFAEKNIRIGKGANAETTDGLRVRDFVPRTTEQQEKADLKGKIRAALDKYQGEDKASIKEVLNTKVTANEDTIEYLTNTLNHLLNGQK